MTERFNATLLNMLGTLEEEQKKDWKAYVPALVQAYNSTKHDSTGYSPFFLMFGRHPRLPIDVALGIHPEEDQKETDYVRSLRDKLQFAFEVATRNAQKAAGTHKKYYDRRIRGGPVEVGDRVLVRNTGVRGKCKLANRWESIPYTVVDQPDPDIPVFKVLQDGKRTATRTLHRNMLLPINFLPLPPGASTAHHTSESRCEESEEKEQDKEDCRREEEEQEEYGGRRESEEESDSEEFVFNPFAAEFHPAHPIGPIPPTFSASVETAEDPQVAEFKEQEVVEEVHQSDPLDVVEDLYGEAARDEEVDEDVEDVDEEETASQEVTEEEHSAVGDAVVEEVESGLEEDTSGDHVGDVEMEREVVAPTPAPRYPKRDRKPVERYQAKAVVQSTGVSLVSIAPEDRMQQALEFVSRFPEADRRAAMEFVSGLMNVG